MQLLEKAKELFSRKKNSVKSSYLNNVTKFDIIKFDIDEDFEKEFQQFTTFKVAENNKLFTIIISFKPKFETEKKQEMADFIKDGLNGGAAATNVFAVLCMVYGVQLSHRGIPKENKILIFIG